MNQLIEKYLGEGKGLDKWAKITKKDGKSGKLIGHWDDLGAYYDIDGTAWYTTGKNWVNKGKTDDFKKQMKKGRWRGKLIEGNQARPLSTIAMEIRRDWKKVNYAAEPYLSAMAQLNSINDKYMFDDARSVVLYFLSNAGTWKGPKAKEIKKELKAMTK